MHESTADVERLLKQIAQRTRKQFHNQPTAGHSTNPNDCWQCLAFVQIVEGLMKP